MQTSITQTPRYYKNQSRWFVKTDEEQCDRKSSSQRLLQGCESGRARFKLGRNTTKIRGEGK